MTKIITPKTTLATVAALVAGPVVTTIGMALTPWESEPTTAAYQAALAADPVRGQWAALALVAGYALLGLAYFTVLRRCAGAPKLLRRAAAVTAFLAATVLPGLVSVDFYDLALAQTLPVDQAVAVADRAQSYALGGVIRAASGLGFVFAGLLTLSAAWRARIVPGWVPLLMSASMAVPMVAAGAGAFIGGAALMVIAFAGVAANLRRADSAPTTAPHLDQPATPLAHA